MIERAKSQSHGERRRARILEAAADVSTSEGLEGLSIGRLAREVGMSKSGVAAHFESKEDLQLHAVSRAAVGYEERVTERAAEPGLARAQALMEAWIDYIEGSEYRGGCFFAAAGSEFAGRPGPVRDELARHVRSWILILERELRTAVGLGELAPASDPKLLAFQLHALVQEANLRRTLLDDDGAFDDARALLAATLTGARRDSGKPGEHR